jgi:sugar O-acyltransferase (sialic acid O-acetyltransferase NeuD family)
VQPLVIYGAGGHAREIAELVRDINADRTQWDLLGFLSDEASARGRELDGLPVLGDQSWLQQHKDMHVAIGVGSPSARRAIAHALGTGGVGVRSPVLLHPTAVVSRHVEIGVGTLVTAGCIVTVDVSIGTFVVLNRACNVSHDCRLGDYVTIGPGVQLAGNVTIATGCDVGIGASVIQGVSIGEWAIVGAGAAVTDALPANCTAVGVPAKVIKQRQPGWHLTQ